MARGSPRDARGAESAADGSDKKGGAENVSGAKPFGLPRYVLSDRYSTATCSISPVRRRGQAACTAATREHVCEVSTAAIQKHTRATACVIRARQSSEVQLY